jgi:hypothetical protein
MMCATTPGSAAGGGGGGGGVAAGVQSSRRGEAMFCRGARRRSPLAKREASMLTPAHGLMAVDRMAHAVAKPLKELPAELQPRSVQWVAACLPRGKPAGGWADGERNSENSWIFKRLSFRCFAFLL